MADERDGDGGDELVVVVVKSVGVKRSVVVKLQSTVERDQIWEFEEAIVPIESETCFWFLRMEKKKERKLNYFVYKA